MQRLMYQVIAIVFLVGQLILSPLSMIQASAAYAPEVAHDGTTIETSADIETTEATDPEIESDPASDTKEGEPNQSPENEQTTEGETETPIQETPVEEENNSTTSPETVDDEQKLQDESSSEEATEDETEEATEEEDEDRTTQDEVSDGQLLSAGQLDFNFGSMVIGNATVTDAASAKNVRPKSGESVTVNYNFKLNTDSGNDPIQKGDYFTFQLPQALLVFDQTSLSGTIGTPGAMFNYKTDGNGQVTVVSLQDIQTGQVTGNLTFGAHFSLDGASDDFEQNLEIPIQGKETITIPLTFYPAFDEGIEKTGKGPEGEPTGKDDLINWTVNINPSPASTESVEVTDKLSVDHPSGAKVKHEYAGPITITTYKLDVHGNKEEVIKKTVESFPLTLEKEEGPYVFELTYQTKVNVEQYALRGDDNPDPEFDYLFKNSVTYNGETATADVPITYPNEEPDLPLTKSMSTKAGDDSQLRYSYEVVYNPNAEHESEELEEGANVITDVLTKGSELYTYDKESFKIFERTSDGDDPEELEGLTINDSSFTYEIPEYLEGAIIVIKYDVVYKNGEYFTDQHKDICPEVQWICFSSLELANEVEIGGVKKDTSHKNDAQQYLKKSVAEIDYVNQEIKWTIHGKVPKGAKEFTIEDTFKPKEEEYGPHTLVEGSFELNGLNATPEPKKDGFTIRAVGPFESTQYTISYRTKYELNEDFETYQRYGNTAKAQWIGSDDRAYDVEEFNYHEFKTNNPATKNGYKEGKWVIDSSSFEMEWKVGINTNFHSLQGAVVTDTLSDNHVLIPESLEVYELELAVNNSEGIKGEKVTSGYKKEVSDDSWKVTFTEDTNKAYLITYKTKDKTGMHVKDEDAKRLEYKNTAKLDIPGVKEQTYEERLEWKTPDQFIEKSVTGNKNASNRLLTWTIELNKSLSNLGETVITDRVSDNQMLLEGSFQLIPYYADKNTAIKEATDQARTIDVDVSNDKKSFTFTEDLAYKGYKLVYQTYYLGGHDEAISNTASMEYQGTTKDSQVGGSGDETKFTFNRSEGDVGYDTGTLKIEKRGEYDGADLGPIENVHFTLQTTSGLKLYEGITDRNGHIEFPNLGYGTYQLVEQTPEGYASTGPQEITFGSEHDVKTAEGTPLIITNESLTPEKPEQPSNVSYEVLKVDADTEEPLAGVQFELRDEEGKVIRAGTTNAQGKLTFTNVREGEYVFVETQALDGYEASNKHHQAVAGGTITVENKKEEAPTPTPETMTVKLTKVDAKNEENVLPGATFKLYQVVAEGEDVLVKNGESDTFVTDENGTITVTDLEKGDYYFVEVQAPKGYVLDETPKHVNDDGTLVVKNEKETAPLPVVQQVLLEKVDAADVNIPLEGAEFELFNAAGQSQGKYTTDENGKILINGLPKDDYYFVETKAPEGYQLSTEKHHVKNLRVTVKNEKQCEDFTVVVKEDGKPVEKDTEYTFESEDGKTTVTEKTDKDGKIVIDRDKLPEGKYTVTDKDGNKVGEIEVEYDECGTELDVTTEKPTKPTDPETPEQCEDFTVVVKEDGKPVEKDTEYTFESEDGKTTVTEKTDENGKIVIDREELPEGKYTVTDKDGNKVGEIEVEYEECGTELDITTEEPGGGGGGTPPTDPEEPTKPTDPETPEQCEDFTVVVKEDGKPVEKDTEYTFESEDGETKITEKTDKDGKIVIERKDLPKGKYTVTDKDGNKVGEIEVEYDECGTELDMTTEEPGGGGGGTPPTDPEEPTKPTDPESPEQCEDFTVTVKEDGKPVEKDTEYTFESEDGKTTVTEKTDKDGKIVIDREELPEGKYTVTDKDGNKVGEIEVEYDECGTELDMTTEEPGGGGGGTPPTDPEEPTKPTDPESPEQCEDFTVTVKEDGKPVEKDTEYTFESEDGKTTVTEKTDKDGKIVIDREELPEGKYTVTDKDGNKVGEIEVEYDECGTELDMTTEEPGGGGGGTPPTDPEEPTKPTDPEAPEQCEDFTVTVKEDGKPVEKDTEYTFESEDGKTTVTEKTDENGTITIDREKLPEGKYTVTDKDGNKVGEIEVEYDECGTELDMTTEEPTKPTDPEAPEQCEDFTVTVKEDGKPVEKDTEYTFESEDGKTTVTETTDENGKIIIDREELPEGKYTVTDKDGNKVGEIEVEYDECGTELDMTTEEPGGGGGTPPTDPEEPTKPTDPEAPEQCEDFTVTVKEDGKPVEKDTEYTFESEDGKTTVTEKTDKDGKIVIDREELPEGKYTVTDKDGNKVGEIEVEYDECGTELDVTKKPADDTVSVTLVKHDANDENKRLAGATFDLFTQAGEKVGTYTTDEHGTIVVTDLAQDEYYFVETKAPKGYKLTKEKQHVLFEDGNPTGQVKVANEEDSSGGGGGGGNVDPEKPKPEPGPEPERPIDPEPTDPTEPEQCEDFTVTVKENGKPVKEGTEYTFESEDGETKVTGTTDKNGTIVIDREKLPEGKYTVTDKDGNKVGEIEVEYKECGTELDVKEDQSGGGGGEDPKDPEKPTTPTDPETPEQCEDFTVVVKEDGKPVEKDTEYTFESEDGETKVTAKTDENGTIVIDREELPEGKYTVTDKDGNKVGEIEVEYDECGTELDIKTEGSSSTGKTKVTLTKVDHKDETLTLEGAAFELYKKVDNGPDQLVMNGSSDRFVTDENGEINVVDLAEGDYYFVEKKAPKGYQLNRKAQDFKVVENEAIALTVTNKKRPSGGGGGGGGSVDPDKPGTDEDGETPTDEDKPGTDEDGETPTDEDKPGTGEDGETPTDEDKPGTGEDGETPTDEDKPGTGEDGETPTDEDKPGTGEDGETPTDEDKPGTGKPTNPEGNGTVGKPTPSGPATPGKTESNQTDSKGSKLPQTGEEQFIALIGFGALFVAFGGWLFFRNRRKEEQK